MRLNRSARVMLATTVTLLGFASFNVWHEKPLDLNQPEVEAIQFLIQSNPELRDLLNQIDREDKSRAFYSVGVDEGATWPVAVGQACYRDPVAAWGQFSAIQKAYSQTIQVVRYRSRNDFCLILLTRIEDDPDYLSKLRFKTHKLIAAHSFAISLRLIVAVLVGVFGLLLVRDAKRQRNLKKIK